MATRTDVRAEPRRPLNRDRVLDAAVEFADREGIDALSMRRLGQDLGVEAMSLYNHVANKEDLLNGIVDKLMIEVQARCVDLEPPASPEDWKRAVRDRITIARSVMVNHPWAPRVIETRTEMSPSLIGYFDAILGEMRAGGFSYDLAHHAMHALGSRAIGFTQELFEPETEEDERAGAAMLEQMADVFPNLIGMINEIAHDPEEDSIGWCDDQTEFFFALDLLLDGLERLNAEA